MSLSLCRPRIGEVFVELGLIDRAKLALGLAAQRQGERLGEALLRLGFIDGTGLRIALVEQYRRWLSGAVGLTMLALQGGPAAAAASSSATLQLRLTIPVRTNVTLVDTTADLAVSVAGGSIARIAEESNSRSSYSILIESESASRHGSPLLVGTDGTQVPYSILRGSDTLRFTEGRAVVRANRGERRVGGAPTELRIAFPPGAALAETRYADTLRLVVRAE